MTAETMNRRQFMKASIGAATALAAQRLAFGQSSQPAGGPGAAGQSQPASSPAAGAPGKRLNFLFITADDMNYNAPGFTGNPIPGLTPNMDKLASQGLWVVNAHVAAAICMPSRQAMMTGRYPHNNGAPGFDPIDVNVPTLQEQLHAAGYLNGILGKVKHLAPAAKFPWDYLVDAPDLGMGRDPDLYYQHVSAFLAQARQAGKSFFLMANSHDPHRPFAGSDDEKAQGAKKGLTYPPARKYYKPEEVAVPGFLADIPDVRKEVAQYYSSVHRCDETVGQILRALADSGLEGSTVVMFLSDNGMAFPYAKTNCYLTSTRTPWLVRWPGLTKPGSIDREHFICGIDFMPTILAAAGLPALPGMDGRSFVPILSGARQPGREQVFTVINTNSAKQSFPMRAVQNQRFGYLYNSWSDGQRVFKNESQSGLTFKAMKAAAETDPQIAQRVKLFVYRQVEELYDFQKDPDGLKNLIDDPAFKDDLGKMRKAMLEAMTATNDPLLANFKEQVPAAE